jgi:hypothetical protein
LAAQGLKVDDNSRRLPCQLARFDLRASLIGREACCMMEWSMGKSSEAAIDNQ